MIVNKRLLRLADGAFDGVQLLRQIEAGAAFLDHDNDLVQMATGAAQALEDVRVRLVARVTHFTIVSSWIGYVYLGIVWGVGWVNALALHVIDVRADLDGDADRRLMAE